MLLGSPQGVQHRLHSCKWMAPTTHVEVGIVTALLAVVVLVIGTCDESSDVLVVCHGWLWLPSYPGLVLELKSASPEGGGPWIITQSY